LTEIFWRGGEGRGRERNVKTQKVLFLGNQNTRVFYLTHIQTVKKLFFSHLFDLGGM